MDIVLATLNAKYIHSAFGLRYLLANLGLLRSRTRLLEFDIRHRPLDIAETLLSQQPAIIGLGVYIWNVGPTTELVAILKRLRPDVTVILGGPEVSYESDQQEICRLADYVITGEADLAFAETCSALLGGRKPERKVIPAPLPDFDRLALPYDEYTAQDIAHRVLYVEASRGCPFSCEFCLSSLDIPVRQAETNRFLAELQKLLDRGARHLKFVDRTFNLSTPTSQAILQFLLERYQPGHLYHFEMVPDRLPEPLRAIIARFPPGALQFEVGIQTFNPEVAERISRRQNYLRLEENIAFLRENTRVHVHADLIFGLPGESLESFAAGFDRLVQLGPEEIQVGILKRLRGTPIGRHDAEWEMVYSPLAPYEILRNKLIPFAVLQNLRRFARYYDLVANSGNFIETTPWFWTAPTSPSPMSPFYSFLEFAEWLFGRVGRTDSIALSRLMELVYEFLTQVRGHDATQLAQSLWNDYRRGGRKDKPGFLCPFLPPEPAPEGDPTTEALPKRQARRVSAMKE